LDWVLRRIAVITILILSTNLVFASSTKIEDRLKSGYKANVKKVGSSYGLLSFSGDKTLQVRIAAGTAGNADGNPEYVGWAEVSSLDSATEWRIVKITWDADGPTGVYFADQVDTFTKEWDERTSYDYIP